MKDFWKKQAAKWKMCFLAPMDWYGDSAYRQTMKRVSPHIYLISEFYSADGLVHSQFLADSVLPHQDMEKPVVIQIFGKNPENFAKAAKIIERYNIAGIDVNMWCPAKKVVRSWHGSSLFINEELAFRIVDTLNKATKLPISVKTRLSFDGNQDLIKFAKGLENAGAGLLTIHGRTAKQAYTGHADFTNIYELKKHVWVPVVCNWDVMNYEDGIKKVQDLDWFMIGRWSFGNPWCFLGAPHGQHIKNSPYLNPANFIDNHYHPSLWEILDTMEFHASKLVEVKWERKGSLEIRKHLVQYLKSFPGVKIYRKRLVTTESIENSREVIDEIRNRYIKSLDLRPSLNELDEELN